jgi:hypothetical protein
VLLETTNIDGSGWSKWAPECHVQHGRCSDFLPVGVAFRTRLFEPGLNDLTLAFGRHRLASLDVRHVEELIAGPE